MTMNAYIPRRDYYAHADGPEFKITVPANSEVDEATRRLVARVYKGLIEQVTIQIALKTLTVHLC